MSGSSETTVVTQVRCRTAWTSTRGRPAPSCATRRRCRRASRCARTAARPTPRSILQVLALGATGGSELEVEASGEGAEPALQSIAELLSSLT